MDLVTIGSAIQALKGLKGLLGNVKDAGVRVELQGVVIDLSAQLMETMNAMVALQDENRALAEQLALRAMELRDGMYWDGDDGPFCPRCADGDGKRARVVVSKGDGFYMCTVCDRSPKGAPRPRGW